jgi:cytochrome b6-f complex iron-sulfur subunit/menaquinol-cytochrome c reductase iron-sulfur subunit
MPEAPKTDRRSALKVIATTGGVVGAGALALPALRFVVAPAAAGAGEGRWIKAVALEVLKEGEPKRIALVADHKDAWTLEKNVELGAVWLVREGDAVKAWSVVCPHLGCAVDRSSTGPGFYCPCHDSSFDPAGHRLSGPSPRDLDALATRIEDGVVAVEFQRFRQGTPDKTPMG